jgi:flagellar hook-associated protein 3 FlgL
MISGVDASAEQFLADLERTQARTQRAERQISSGLKFNDASDAPDQVSDILKLRADISRNSQVSSNLGTVGNQVNAAEQAVEAAVQLVERARTLAAQGATGTQTAPGRLQIAQEVRSVHEQLVALSATEIGGRFVFGGDADQSAPYAIDPLNPNTAGGAAQLTTAQATRKIEDSVGNTFAVDLTAQQIFDHQNPDGTPAADNVFAAVNQLRVALEANDQPGIQNATDALKQAGDYLNAKLSFYGAAQNRIGAASELSARLAIQFISALGQKQDADLAQAVTELNQSQLQQQASLQARAKVRKTSLFDYLG